MTRFLGAGMSDEALQRDTDQSDREYAATQAERRAAKLMAHGPAPCRTPAKGALRHMSDLDIIRFVAKWAEHPSRLGVDPRLEITRLCLLRKSLDAYSLD